MVRKVVCAVAVLALSVGFAMSEEIKGRITKLDASGLTIVTKKGEDGKEYKLAKGAKFCKRTKEGKEECKVDDIKIGKKGTFGIIVTNDAGQVTEVVVGGGKKKKKGT